MKTRYFGAKGQDIPTHQVTIDEVDQETGLDFLNTLPDNVRKEIENSKPTAQELNNILN